MMRNRSFSVFVLVGCVGVSAAAYGGLLQVGDLATDFALVRHGTTDVVNLYDYEGSVLVLDFFAYWCPHCKVAAAELHPGIVDYYAQRGGNPDGLPVQLIPISVDNRDPSAVDQFARDYHLEFVLDDPQYAAFSVYGDGYIPHLTIINGAANANHAQWEILFSEAGYYSGQVTSLRSLIDSVEQIGPPTFDFNGDAAVDVMDIDLLMDEIAGGSDRREFDLDGDGLVRYSDLLELVTTPQGLNTYVGDANLDGEFSSDDFVQVLQTDKYESLNKAGWAEGDWTADGLFDSGDFVAAFAHGGYELGPRSGAAAVPEPASLVLLISGLLVGAADRRR